MASCTCVLGGADMKGGGVGRGKEGGDRASFIMTLSDANVTNGNVIRNKTKDNALKGKPR